MCREPDRIAGTGLRRERHVAVDAGKDPRLQVGGLHLVVDAPADQPQDRQHHCPAQDADAAEQRPTQHATYRSARPLRIALSSRNAPSLTRLVTRRIEMRQPSQYVGNGHMSRSALLEIPTYAAAVPPMRPLLRLTQPLVNKVESWRPILAEFFTLSRLTRWRDVASAGRR